MFISFFAATESFNALYFFLSRRQLHCVLSDTLAMPPSKEKVRRTFQLEWTTIARRVKLCARSRRPLKQLVRVHLILFFLCVSIQRSTTKRSIISTLRKSWKLFQLDSSATERVGSLFRQNRAMRWIFSPLTEKVPILKEKNVLNFSRLSASPFRQVLFYPLRRSDKFWKINCPKNLSEPYSRMLPSRSSSSQRTS